MAEERDLTHDGIAGAQDAGVSESTERSRAGLAPGTYPADEILYWKETYSAEPYYEQGRLYEDYSPAYELGWLGYRLYGGTSKLPIARSPTIGTCAKARPI